MKLPLDWILQDPIDMEHKEYVLLDYISKIDKDLENFNLYPTFQELSLHMDNLGSINKNLSVIDLKNKPKEIDDEILVADLEYRKLKEFNTNKLKELLKISQKSYDKLKDHFLIAKSIWSIVFDSVLIKNENKSLKFKGKIPNKGYITFYYDGERHVYKFRLKKINPDYNEKKCEIKKVDSDKVIDDKIKEKNFIFKAEFNEKFPLEGCLLSIVKRKVLNYIFQTVKLSELKASHDK